MAMPTVKEGSVKKVLTPVEEKPMVRQLNTEKKGNPMMFKKLVPLFVIIVLLGVASGYAMAKMGSKGTSVVGTTGGGSGQKIVGVLDVKGKDSAEGTLKAGGVENEGTHHLERPGGPSQNVYLTSSVIPLDDYAEKKVKVWGDTFSGQSAGWLMDVVKLEVIE